MGTCLHVAGAAPGSKSTTARTSVSRVVSTRCCGPRPVRGQVASHAIVSILDREPPPLAPHLATAEALQEVVSDALTKDPEARFQTAKQMLSKLQRLKHRLDAGVHLDHSVAPNATAPSGEVLTGWPGVAPDTSSAQTAISALHRTAAAPFSTGAAQTAGSAERDAAGARRRARDCRAARWRRCWRSSRSASQRSRVIATSRRGRARARFPVRGHEDYEAARLGHDARRGHLAGRQIRRARGRGGRKSSLRLRQVATPNEREIASSPEPLLSAVTFSPDGNFIYYTQGRKGSAGATSPRSRRQRRAAETPHRH